MNYKILTNTELDSHYVGAAISITAVLAILASAAVAVVLYRVFMSTKGTAAIGGWKFSWN